MSGQSGAHAQYKAPGSGAIALGLGWLVEVEPHVYRLTHLRAEATHRLILNEAGLIEAGELTAPPGALRATVKGTSMILYRSE